MWNCQKCGCVIKAKVRYPVRCRCGETDNGQANDTTIEWCDHPADTTPLPERHQDMARSKRRAIVHQCQHRGDEIRQEECQTCRGKVMIKVFRCELHGECQLKNKLPGVHVCDGGEEIARVMAE